MALRIGRFQGPLAFWKAWRCAGTWAFQETPNPKVWKFQSENVNSVPKSARNQLLELPGVQDVLVHEGLSGTWLAITKQSGTEWQVLAPQLQTFLQNLPESEAEGLGSPESPESKVPDDALEIREVLEHRIRPSVQEDGGDVELKSWDPSTGEVVLHLQGACRGCPQSAVTLQESILKTLKHFVPEVTSVTWMHLFCLVLNVDQPIRIYVVDCSIRSGAVWRGHEWWRWGSHCRPSLVAWGPRSQGPDPATGKGRDPDLLHFCWDQGGRCQTSEDCHLDWWYLLYSFWCFEDFGFVLDCCLPSYLSGAIPIVNLSHFHSVILV